VARRRDKWTRAAYERFEHGLTLVDVARTWMHCGDHMSFTAAETTFSGHVIAVGPYTARLVLARAAVDVVDVHLDRARGVVVCVGRGARREGTVGAEHLSFRARLLELERSDQVLVGVDAAEPVLSGRVRVGRDHVRVTTPEGAATVAGLAAVRWAHRATG
jgi:hypothetical protein